MLVQAFTFSVGRSALAYLYLHAIPMSCFCCNLRIFYAALSALLWLRQSNSYLAEQIYLEYVGVFFDYMRSSL
jgi:hypothetical protein